MFGSGDAFKWWMVGFGLLVGMVCGVAYSVLLKKTIRKVVPSVMVALVVW